MKKITALLLAAFLIALPFLGSAQKKEVFRTENSSLAVFQEPSRNVKGYLLQLEDSALVFSLSRKLGAPWDMGQLQRIEDSEVAALEFRSREKTALGMLVGIRIGGGIGSVAATCPPMGNIRASWKSMP